MAVKVPITVEGNLGSDPEVGTTQDGRTYARLTVVENDRRFNEDTKQWEDAGDPIFHNTVVFGAQADNVAQSLSKGDRVVVTGRLRQRSFETAEGQRRQVIELEVDELGVSLRYATARPQRTTAPTRPDVAGTAQDVDDQAEDLVGGHG